MLALALIALTQTSEARRLELFNGAPLPTGPAYFGCADTYLDSKNPDRNYGGSHGLLGGPGKTVLVRFAGLDRAVGGYRKVAKASLVLSVDREAQLREIRLLTVPWGEGPLNVIGRPQPEKAPRWTATWRARRAGEQAIAWSQPGALGPQDGEPVEGGASAFSEGRIEVTGLERAVQRMLDRPGETHGLALSFATPVEIQSSEAREGRPRLLLELDRADPASGPDLSVIMITRAPDAEVGSRWPRTGEQVVYTAVVKNVGDAPSQGFSARWWARETAGAPLEVTKALAPNEQTTVELRKAYDPQHQDHRARPLALQITPKGPDAWAGNDFLEIHEDAPAVAFVVPPAAREALAREVPSGAVEDAVQARARWINELLAASRYSFAPEGALERYRVGAVLEAPPEGGLWVALSDPADLAALATALALADGHLDLRPTGAAFRANLEVAGGRVSRGGADWAAGLTGGGSTLTDALLPGAVPLPYEPVYSPLHQTAALTPTGLFPATNVALFNARLGKPEVSPAALVPATVMVRAVDWDGRPLANTPLAFHRLENGRLAAEPSFTVTTGPLGTAMLPNSSGEGGAFGGLKSDGSNAAFLVAATRFNAADAALLKAWHAIDAAARTGTSAVVLELRFNLPTAEIDETANLALNKVPADSGDGLPAKLSLLVDGQDATEAELPNEPGSWVELYLGRDRLVAEVALTAAGGSSFWRRFDLMTYSTGETPNEAQPWTREADFAWSHGSRSEPAGPAATVRYRGPAKRFRFLRLVCREPGASAKLAEIRVLAGKTPAGGS